MNQYEMERAMLDEMRRQQQAQLMQQMAAQQQAPVMQAPQINMQSPNIQMPVAERAGFQISPQQGMQAMSMLRSEPMQVPQMSASGSNVIPITPVQMDDNQDNLIGLLSLLSKMGGM